MCAKFKQTDIGLIPVDWDIKELGSVGEYINGYAFKPEDWKEEGKPIIRIQNLNDLDKPFNYYQGEIDQKYKIIDDDILVSWSASLGAFRWQRGEAWLNQHIFKVIYNEKYLDKDFFYWILYDRIGKIALNARGSTMRHVTVKIFNESLIPLPSLLEQKKIAQILSKIQQSIETQEQIIKTTQELKKALMQKLFTEGLNGEPQKQTEIGLIPKSWEVKKIGEITKIQTGGTPSRSNPIYWNGDIPWVKTGEVNYDIILNTEEKITLEGLNNSATRIAPKGTLLVAMYGQGITRGRVAILGIEAAFNQACAALFPDEDTVLTKYLFLYLTYNYEYLRSLGHGANQRNLNTNLIKSVSCPIPSLGEQKIIVDSIWAVDEKLKSYLLKIKILKDLFSSSLNSLMTGQIRVKDIEFKL